MLFYITPFPHSEVMRVEEQHQLFLAAKEAQLVRNEATQIILSDASHHSALHGAFVRVLVELPDQSDSYIIARVGAVTTGEPYDGFSHNTSTRTDKYLVLVLPHSLASINGTQYQLNSISNSPMTEDEFNLWLSTMQEPGSVPACAYRGVVEDTDAHLYLESSKIPSRQELLAIGGRIHALGSAASQNSRNPNSRRRRSNNGSSEQSLQQPEWMPKEQQMAIPRISSGNGATLGSIAGMQDYSAFMANPTGGAGPQNGANFNHTNSDPLPSTAGVTEGTNEPSLFVEPTTPRPASATEQELDLPSRHQIRQDILNKLNHRSVVFPQNIDELKLSQLRLVERDMIEYLEHVRDVLSSKQENCVVCLDHVPTVISLPCRHKVLCRLCASAVSTCPVCRSHLFELFEPKEI
ncbi:hypothetical protein, conserved [Trypanosoma brucei brucei TREU927]|uniref:RING-type domain-containing protein n=2 Tax=Trypanozoon TaxID=39700 RepID=Q382T7_TRYB2|nr:hypothetical protein, conserved [Trypanosoma brucei brucei TREU927]EAN80194.1 hypothetical protein, conserved [Trypanosoma brucei brucei TREU927]